MKKQLLFRRFPAVLLALLTVLMLALLPACGGMTTRPMGEDDPLVQENGTLLGGKRIIKSVAMDMVSKSWVLDSLILIPKTA